MLAEPQPIVIRKKPGKSVKPRPRKREQSQSSLDMTASTETTDTTDSIENINPLSHLAAAYAKRKPTSSIHAIAIEDYIDQKPQPNFHETLPTSVLSAVATSKAVDDAYDYLFKHLKGQCHGLNVITYPRVGKVDKLDGSESADDGDINAVTRFSILAYIQPGTVYYDWEKIEDGLVHIFKEAAAKKEGDEAQWRLEGVVFELWATKPMAWDIHSGHL